MKLSVDGSEVTITETENPVVPLMDIGECTYDEESRTFILNYEYYQDFKIYQATDTLVFRNRILDGVNQWFD